MLIPTDFPDPVVPAINRCGIFSKSVKIFSPERFDDPIQIINTQCGYGVLEKLNLKDCLFLAEQKNANALFNLGLIYEKGISVKQNFQKAYEYYKKAEALGNEQAKFNIEYLKEKKLIN